LHAEHVERFDFAYSKTYDGILLVTTTN